MERCNCFAHKDMPVAPDGLVYGDSAWEDGKIARIWIRSARERWGDESTDNPCNNMRNFKGYGRATTTRMGKVWQMVGPKWIAGGGGGRVALSYISADVVLVETVSSEELMSMGVNCFGEVGMSHA